MVLGRKKYSYIVYTQNEGRWTANNVYKTERQAMNAAEEALGSRNYDAVKVIEESGKGFEKELWQQKCEGRGEKPITVSAIETAPLCKDLEDFYRFPARRTMGQLLRRYLDREVLSMVEILHIERHAKTLIRMNDTLVNQALSRVSTLHASAADKPQMECRDFLDRRLQEMRERLMKPTEVEKLGALLNEKGFAAVAAKGGKETGQRDFIIRTALAHSLGQAAGWSGKAEVMLDFLGPNVEKAAIPFIDEILAEILDGAEATKEILGHQEDLASALRTLSDLSRGKYEVPKVSPEYVGRLNTALGKYRLTASRQVLLERMRRELGGIKRLTRDEDRQDDAFITLLRGLIVPLGLRGGSGMAEAMVQRGRLVFQSSGQGTPGGAVQRITDTIPIPLSKVGFLLSVASTGLREKAQPVIEQCLAKTLKGMGSLAMALPGAKLNPPLKAAIEELADRAARVDLDEDLCQLAANTLRNLVVQKAAEQKDPEQVLAEATGKTLKDDLPPPDEKEVLPEVLQDHGLEYFTFEQGQTIYDEGSSGDVAYFITNGLAVRVHGKDPKDRYVETVNPENLVGAEILTGRRSYRDTLQALTDVEAFAVPRTLLESRVASLATQDPLTHFVLEALGKA
ncbi:cyclic nucleotide-binding domain-containing protein [Magnetospira sp. QH-2]|uniref:cyclic nucleotide-binding domain-containing protein n=1 Tax=Magnetospira sp. (strain QH-2) TaxID=1288970 RepID=UPI0003E81C06|nr:cyclic nucleotide-binding domain-containing protein [Magnetospira sp. QH-2]CCQ73307.1 Protein of unknown function [Magnetospira sp. QH-2]